MTIFYIDDYRIDINTCIATCRSVAVNTEIAHQARGVRSRFAKERSQAMQHVSAVGGLCR